MSSAATRDVELPNIKETIRLPMSLNADLSYVEQSSKISSKTQAFSFSGARNLVSRIVFSATANPTRSAAPVSLRMAAMLGVQRRQYSP